MKRLLIVATALLLLIEPLTAQAAPSLTQYSAAASGSSNQPQIIWELKGLGRLSAEMQFAPNGQILLPLAGQLASVDTGGELQWNVQTAAGSLGRPVCIPKGSIYAPSTSSIQELGPNGAPGWAFTVYPSTSGTINQWLGCGQNNLYLPLASGLYVLDQAGGLVSLSPWSTSELHDTKLPPDYTFLAGAITGSACYVIDSTDNIQYQMSVFDINGNFLWDCGFPGLKQAYIAAGSDGTVFTATALKIVNRVSHDMVSSFAQGSSQPQWQTGIDENINFLGLSLATTGSLYLALDGKIYALNAKTGAIEWNVLFYKLASPVAVDNNGYIYGGCSDGRLIAIDPTGKLSWALSLDSSISHAPLVGADGFLYVATDSGNLYKIKAVSDE